MRVSRVYSLSGSTNQTATIGADPRRVRLMISPNQVTAGYTSIFLDSVASGNLVGSTYYAAQQPFLVNIESHGDLPQRRFVVQFLNGPPAIKVGVVETIEIEQGR